MARFGMEVVVDIDTVDSGRLGSSRISVARIEEAANLIDPVFLYSPQFVSESLSEVLGLQLLCKVESLNPIRSFKGRGTWYFVERFLADWQGGIGIDRKSTRLNSSHVAISYAVYCLKKENKRRYCSAR